MKADVFGLYAITAETDNSEQLLLEVDAALRGGAGAIQYRDKSADIARQHEQASELKLLCAKYHVPLIINDHLRLAALVDADGVHLGMHDGAIEEARIILGPEKLIGISCYADADRALTAQKRGADYAAFGCFFSSQTKPHATRAPLAVLDEAAARLQISIVAIGGITLDNAPLVVERGADAIAVLGALFHHPHITERARQFCDLFKVESEE